MTATMESASPTLAYADIGVGNHIQAQLVNSATSEIMGGLIAGKVLETPGWNEQTERFTGHVLLRASEGSVTTTILPVGPVHHAKQTQYGVKVTPAHYQFYPREFDEAEGRPVA
jgi:hypothetical protein